MADASCCPLSAVGLPVSVSVLDRIPENGRGARLRRRGDSPALPCGLRVVSPKGKRLTTFCASLALLQNVFAVHRFAQGANGENCIPESKRVQAPAAPGFYRSCADALTDGFCPQSGLVQRECFMLPAAAPPLVPYGTTFAPLESMSLDFRVAMLPYKSSSFATPLKRWDYGRWAVASI